MILSIKIIWTAILFNTTVKLVVQELKRDKKLRKFFKINAVPEIHSDLRILITIFIFIMILSGFNFDTYVKILNNILIQIKPLKKTWKTDIYCWYHTYKLIIYNANRKHRSKKELEKQNLKWSYSSSYGFYIGFKTTVVIEHQSTMPVAIIIHSGAPPHDSKKIFSGNHGKTYENRE